MALDLTQLELALLSSVAHVGSALPAGLELTGRGYARLTSPPLVQVALVTYQNGIALQFPQALAAWGTASYLAVLQIGDPTVLAVAPIVPAMPIAAHDQLRIRLADLIIHAAAPGTPRPYGMGAYGRSLYGGWPAAGRVFDAQVTVEYAWANAGADCGDWDAVADVIAPPWTALTDQCASWAPLAVVAGSCAA